MPSLAWLYTLSRFCVGALVGLTGVGGGSLMTPLLILLFGIHPAAAVDTAAGNSCRASFRKRCELDISAILPVPPADQPNRSPSIARMTEAVRRKGVPSEFPQWVDCRPSPHSWRTARSRR